MLDQKHLDDDYCIIRIKNMYISLSYFKFCVCSINKYLRIDFCSSSSIALYYLLVRHNYLCRSISFSHALYLGKELYKAELAMTLTQVYIQE